MRTIYNFHDDFGTRGPDHSLPWVRWRQGAQPERCQSRTYYVPHHHDTWVCTLKVGHSGKHLGGFDNGCWGAEWDTLPEELIYPEGV